jgi:chromosome segregation ATPase
MAKAPQTSPERADLNQAFADLDAAEATLTQAEESYMEALRAWGHATQEADRLELQISRLRDQKDHGIVQIRIELADAIAAAREALKIEEGKALPFRRDMDQASAHVRECQRGVTAAQERVAVAARRLASVNADDAARASLERLQQAYGILLEVGPDLLASIDKGLVSPELAREADTAGQLLRKAISGWPAFEARYRTSPFRTMVERLQADPQAALPTAPATVP